MTHPAFQIHHSYFVQQYSSSTFRFSNEATYKVMHETWEGSKLLDTEVIKSHETEAEAKAHVARLNKEQ